MRLLIVEDDAALRTILQKRLIAEGYAVDACDNGADGFEFATSTVYDGIILDIMLPGLNGLEILHRLRTAHSPSGILMLTAKDGIADRVKGLDLGADDYLVKPFAFDELLARVRALLRKHVPDRSPLLKLDSLEMDTVARTVSRDGKAVSLTAKEYALLEYMLRNAGQVLTRDQIADHVWNYECNFESNLVDVYVRYLRGKIDKDVQNKLLHTVRGMGYTLKVED
ncbi:MAG: response regulator transcription factor [Eubacteriales bacterium]|nr:response regulator transcription factor [Eubacteriales bacterium]MDD4513435.1 response regulator transcription factor [Eubacteriales bacterium]